MTNEKAFKNLLKELSPIELAILRERLVSIMEYTKECVNKKEDGYVDTIINPCNYLKLAETVEKHLGFSNQ